MFIKIICAWVKYYCFETKMFYYFLLKIHIIVHELHTLNIKKKIFILQVRVKNITLRHREFSQTYGLIHFIPIVVRSPSPLISRASPFERLP